MTVHKGLDPRPFRHDSQLVPAVINRKGMAFLDLLLRCKPTGGERFSVQHARRRQSLIGSSDLDLRPVYSPGEIQRGRAGLRDGFDFGSDLYAGVCDRVDVSLHLELKVVELPQRTQERVLTALYRPADDRAVLDDI